MKFLIKFFYYLNFSKIKNMFKFYIKGSNSIPYISNSMQRKIEGLIENNYKIILSDDYGYEVLLQNFLSLKKYKNIKIYTNNKIAKNNIDGWEIQSCDKTLNEDKKSNFHKSNYNYHSFKRIIDKEKQLVQDCHYGLISFDGADKNTYKVMINLLKHEKPIIVYLHFKKKFFLFEKLKDFFNDKEFNSLFNKQKLQ